MWLFVGWMVKLRFLKGCFLIWIWFKDIRFLLIGVSIVVVFVVVGLVLIGVKFDLFFVNLEVSLFIILVWVFLDSLIFYRKIIIDKIVRVSGM